MDNSNVIPTLLSGLQALLRNASFKGASFKVDVSEFNSGRRAVVHEYPQKDHAFIEDMGRAAREIRVEGWVIGEDYLAQRDVLLAACESPGSGLLIHPQYGQREAACTVVNVRHSTNEGRMARLSMTFVEHGESPFPTASIDSFRQLASRVNQVQQLQMAAFNTAFSTNSSSRDTAVATLSQSLASQVQQMPLQFSMGAGSEFVRATECLHRIPATYWRDPVLFSQTVIQTIRCITTGSKTESTAFKHYMSLVTFADNQSDVEGQAKEFISLTQVIALTEAIYTAGKMQQITWDETVATRDNLVADIDARLEQCDDMEFFTALQDLRGALIRAIPKQADLPRLMNYIPATTLPSLVLAYQLYGDAARAEAITTQNGIVRPGFVPGGAALSILSG